MVPIDSYNVTGSLYNWHVRKIEYLTKLPLFITVYLKYLGIYSYQ